ncbi:alpha-glucosidase C-terminal domain-containing protein, partial [Ligilactobacillus acidipiscis]
GMTNVHFSDISQYEDIESINAYYQLVEKEKIVEPKKMLSYLSYKSRDNARTPMQWNKNKNAGFTEAKEPWFQLNPSYLEINATDELENKDSIFYYYQKLIKLRHNSNLIKYGNYTLLDPEDNQVFAYKRQYQGKTLLVISNFTAKDLERDYGQEKGKLVIGNYSNDLGQQIRPYETKVYQFNR